MRGRVWSGRSALGVGVGITAFLVSIVVATVWLLGLTDGDDGAGIANVLALPLTMLLGLPPLIWGWRARPRADDPLVLAREARRLLDVVATTEARTLATLLGDTGRARPADVGFAQPEAAQVTWRTDGGTVTGSLNTVTDFYDTLELGRLLVLGAAGSGKTVLVLQLLRDLADRARPALESGGRTTVRVPVRLSLPSFIVPTSTVDAGLLRAALDDWMTRQLTVRGTPKAIARALVDNGWVLPILDGLDEMDPDDGDAPRAQQVLAALNDPVGSAPGPVVLTCRAHRYARLARTSGGVLQDATAVTLQPLDAEQVISWLAYRFPDSTQQDGLQKRWRRVATTLRKHPRGRLAACLTTPLRLYLATAVFQSPDTKPARMCEMDADELEKFLFAQLVPALTRHHPRDEHSHYRPDDVGRWLTTLADHLAVMAKRGQSGVDLYPLRLWGTSKSATRTRSYTAVLSGTATFFWVDNSLLDYALTSGLIAIVVGIGVYHGEPWKSAGNIGRVNLRALVVAVLLNVAFVVAYHGLVASYDYFWVLLLWMAVHAFLFFLVTDPQHSIERPSSAIRLPLWTECVSSSFFVFFLYLNSALQSDDGLLWETFSLATLLDAVPLCAIGVVAFLGVDGTAAHFVSALRPKRGDELPRRLGQFLDWAYHAGLLRMSGTATQFRHRELQDHFTTVRTRRTARPRRR